MILGYARLLRRGPVRLLWGAQTLSVFGDRLYAMAIMWIAWKESGAALMGWVAVAESIPYIVLGTLGRGLVARFASLQRLAAVDVGRGVLVALLPWAWDAFGTPGVLAVTVLVGAGGALFDPNLGALVPDLVERGEVQAVNGLMDLTGRIARVAGPGAAGVLLAVVPQNALFFVQAGTFVVSAAALARLASARPGRGAKAPAGAAGPRERVLARAVLRERPETAVAIGVHGAGIFAHSVAIILPAFLASRLDAGAGVYGAALAATGLGALAANMAAGNMRLPGRLPVFYCALWAASGLLLAATGLSVSVVMLLALSVLLGVVNPFLGVSLSTHLASFPPGARLRLMSVDLTVIRTAGTVAMLFVPAVAARWPAGSFVAAGSGLVVVAGAGAAVAALRPQARPTAVRAVAGRK